MNSTDSADVKISNIAVLTSGGDAPGMNAASRSVVRSAAFYKLNCFGVYRGYEGMIEGSIKPLGPRSVNNIINKGGTILKSARSNEFRTKEGRKKAYDKLQELGIEGLVAIGGNGTFTGAEIFYNEYKIYLKANSFLKQKLGILVYFHFPSTLFFCA